jgi:hypothetical protein
MGRKAQVMGITVHGGPAGEFRRGLVYWGLAKALGTGTFSIGTLLSIMGGGIHREL